MTHVYLLWHIHDLGDEEDWKFIGVYSSEGEVEEARARVAKLPGFRETPESFRVERVEVDRDLWTEGFVTGEAEDGSAGG
jgi:hypothetical protein